MNYLVIVLLGWNTAQAADFVTSRKALLDSEANAEKAVLDWQASGLKLFQLANCSMNPNRAQDSQHSRQMQSQYLAVGKDIQNELKQVDDNAKKIQAGGGVNAGAGAQTALADVFTQLLAVVQPAYNDIVQTPGGQEGPKSAKLRSLISQTRSDLQKGAQNCVTSICRLGAQAACGVDPAVVIADAQSHLAKLDSAYFGKGTGVQSRLKDLRDAVVAEQAKANAAAARFTGNP